MGQFKIKMDYDGNQGLTIDRIIHPLGLAQKNQQWYLVAYCEMRKDYRVFKLLKIAMLKLCDSTFKMPPNFNLETFWESSINRYTGHNTNPIQLGHKNVKEKETLKKGYLVELECDRSLLGYLNAFELIFTSERTHTFNLISENIAMSQLFLHCDEIKIISPEPLKNRIKRKAEMPAFFDKIYEEYLPENKLKPDFAISFERYDERFSKTGECDIYIPVK